MSGSSSPRPATPYGAAGPEALLRLGLDVHAPLRDLRSAYQRLLPAASEGGYFVALQLALRRGEVAAGDDDGQLRWLAEHLRLSAPRDDDISKSWACAWRRAVEAAGVAEPPELGPRGRRVLLDELLALPRYQLRLTDALVAALRAELKS